MESIRWGHFRQVAEIRCSQFCSCGGPQDSTATGADRQSSWRGQLDWGARGPEFKSRQPDQPFQRVTGNFRVRSKSAVDDLVDGTFCCALSWATAHAD